MSPMHKDEEKDPQGSVYVDPLYWSHTDSCIPVPCPESIVDTNVSGVQTMINMQNHGNHNRLQLGDDNSDNTGIIGHKSINILVQHYHNAQASKGPISMSTKVRSMVTYIVATQQVLGALFGFASPKLAEYEKNGSEGQLLEVCIGHLIESIKSIIERDDPGVTRVLRNQLSNLRSELRLTKELLSNADNKFVDVETTSLDVTSRLRLFLFVNHMDEYIPSEIALKEVKNRMEESQRNTEIADPRKLITDLPRVKAAYNDYVSSHQRRVSCFKGTRKALLKEMGEWVAKAETNIFALSGLAGIGKSTIAQTVAERADNVGLLGASFFFSRDEVERRTAEKFFTTISFQLCVHDPEFASAIETILKTERGNDAVTKLPMEQLEKLILEPLRELPPRRVLIVVDALDECNEEDGPAILKGLHRLVLALPLFKVVLTTRPQQHFQLLLDGKGPQNILHLHKIEDRVVDDDIRLYLQHHLSREAIQDNFQDPMEEWNANDSEIESLVKTAGRLFIIASTSVLFVLDKAAHDPEHRMTQLLEAIADGKTPFEALNKFYTVILRSALPVGCDPRAVVRYQSVIGAIILVQTPLPIKQLAKFIGHHPIDIHRVLGKLRPVIVVDNDEGNDVPRVYHKSFPDFIHDPARCKDEDLLIDLKPHHARIAIYCLRTMNQQLRQNILELGNPARFMDNAVLRQCYVTQDQFEEKFPLELRYACTYWAHHVKGSATEDKTLVDSLETFVKEHLLHWFEALSWIGQLGSVHRSLLTLQKRLKATTPDLAQLVADGLRFVGKFYEIVKRSAMHTYHSALPFTPTETSFYERYGEGMTFSHVQGGPKKWDALIANVHVDNVRRIVFSSNSKMFACHGGHWNSMNIYDAVGGIPIGRTGEGRTAIANDFSKAAVADDSSITLYNIKSITPVATIKPYATVLDLELSPDGSRLVVGSKDRTLGLWDTGKCQLIKSFIGWKEKSRVAHSSTNRFAFVTCDGTIQLLDGRDGRIVANMQSRDSEKLMFSGNGSRLFCQSLVAQTLKVWHSMSGEFIGMAEGVGGELAVSIDGCLLVTGDRKPRRLKFWGACSGSRLVLVETLILDYPISSLAISQTGLLGIAGGNTVVLYDTNNRTIIARLPLPFPTSIAFSPNCTRLAAGGLNGNVSLWDILSTTASCAPSQRRLSAPPRFAFALDYSRVPTRLALSPDCSLLASGHEDGTIKLWDTSNPTEPIAVHLGHSDPVTTLAFSIDGKVFASGSREGNIRLWKDKNQTGHRGVPGGYLKCHMFGIRGVALSRRILAAASAAFIKIWDLDTRAVIATLDLRVLDQSGIQLLTLSHHNRLLAAATYRGLTLWDIRKRTQIATFNHSSIIDMTFSYDCSRLAIQCDTGVRVYSIHDNNVSENQDLNLSGLWPCLNGFPVWLQEGNVVAQFPQQAETATVLYKPNGLDVQASAVGSSMIALGCKDGRILLVKAI